MAAPALVAKDFKPEVAPDWCPGCGDYSILTSVQKVVAEMEIPRENLVFPEKLWKGVPKSTPGSISG